MPPAATLAPDARDLIPLAPMLVLAAWGLVVLGVDLGMLRGVASARRGRVLSLVGLVGVLLALVAAFLPELLGRPTVGEPSLVLGAVSGGPLVARLDALILVLLGLVVALAPVEDFTDHWGEAFALLAWSGVGMMLLVAAEELLTLFVGLELMTIGLYLLAAFGRGGAGGRSRSPEAGLKYFVYGSVSSALFLFGLSLLYGMAGTTRLAAIGAVLGGGGQTGLGLTGDLAGASAVLLILAGLGFKLAAAPFHQWAPDVYEGAPTAVAAWLASASKAASVVALMRVLIQALGPLAGAGGGSVGPGFVGVVALLAAASMCLGNLAALNQAGLKRLLAYSAIGQTGYLLVGVLAAVVAVDPAGASGAVLFYLATYAVTTIGAFAVATWLGRATGSDRIDDLDGLWERSPLLASAIALIMVSLIGLPPTAGFFGKLFMFIEALNVDPRHRLTFLWLVGLGFLNSVVSAFYYARILRALFLRPARLATPTAPAPPAVAAAILLGAVVALGCGVTAPALVRQTVSAARSRLLRPAGVSTPIAPVRAEVDQPGGTTR